MRRVLFVIPSFDIGGTTTSLLNLLAYIDKERFFCYVYAINNSGVLRQSFDSVASVVNPTTNNTDASNNHETALVDILKRLYRILKKCGFDLSPLYFRRIAYKWSEAKYDTVVAFQEGNATKLVSYCRGVKKIAWVRSEYSRYLTVSGHKPEKSIYQNFDAIVNVSETAKNNFVSILPQLGVKTFAIYNIVDYKRIIEQSKEQVHIPGKKDVFTMISVGRVDPVKHFTEIPVIAKTLLEKGLSFRWLIIGGKTESNPREYKLISELIEKYNLQNIVFQLGHQTNPYAYILNSELLVCLSESETFNHTFAESRLLGVPVISVDYPSSSEFIHSGEGGLIVKRNDIPNAIIHLIQNNNAYQDLKRGAISYNYNNECELNKMYSLF